MGSLCLLGCYCGETGEHWKGRILESSEAQLGALEGALGAVQETGSNGGGTGSPGEDPENAEETVEHCRKLSLTFTSPGQPIISSSTPVPAYFPPSGREGTVLLLCEPTSQIWIPSPKFQHVQGLLPHKRYGDRKVLAFTSPGQKRQLCSLVWRVSAFVRMNTYHCSKAYSTLELESQPKKKLRI